MPQNDAICHDDEDTDDKFRGDDDVYNDNGEDYSDLLHPVQLLKNHLRLIHGSMTLDYIRTRFLVGATYMRSD